MTIKTEDALKSLISRPEKLFRALGQAFRPDLTHFSDLFKEVQILTLERIPILAENHGDWGILGELPRKHTAFFGPPPVSGAKPIPKPGEVSIEPGYLALTTEDGVHIRHGFRYDDTDNYYTYVPLTIKRIYEDDEGPIGSLLDKAEVIGYIAGLLFGSKVQTAASLVSIINGIHENAVKRSGEPVDPSTLKDQRLPKR